ncbi:AMP-binding protein [uncultured Shewanella sp.]|uniref:AMP-binding protein n=1 Tax=uncultured Shewanella sp. TaxID=173975 RepID=UPI00260D0B3D|nr:AMP-binding protein [uncultured Shewanella sp.]
MLSVSNKLREIGKDYPLNHPALINGENTISYHQLAHRIEKIQYWLTSLNVNVVGLHLQNQIDWVLIDLACQEANIICIPLPTFFTEHQLQQCIEQTGIELLFSEKATIPSLFVHVKPLMSPIGLVDKQRVFQFNTNVAVTFPKGTQKVTFTSGSTGTPKGVCLSLEHQWKVAGSIAEHTQLTQMRHLCLLPLSTLLENIAGIYAPLLTGGSIYLSDDNTRGMTLSSGLNINTFLSHLTEKSPNSIIVLPQLLSALIQACQKGWQAPDSLMFIAVGGAKVSADLIHLAQEYGLPVFQGYGLSESGSVTALNTLDAHHPQSVGKVMPHNHISIENNEIIIRGSCHLGYLHHPSTWYPRKILTGDTGYIENGYLFINGRIKNTLITSFGRNVNPEWIESELMVANITQCMVLGDGQASLSALISATEQISQTQLQHWINQVNQKLPDYAQIHHWLRVNETDWLPFTTPNGRLHRPSVTERFKHEIQHLYR